MKISSAGLDFLCHWEGCRLRVYADAGGCPTIGVGHLLSRSELTSGRIQIEDRLIQYQRGITEDHAKALLRQDLERFERAVTEAVKVPLSQCQADALISLAFNIGERAFRRSTLVELLNAGDYDAVPDQLQCWTRVNGRIIQGLRNRRAAEVRLWLGRNGN